MDQVTFERLNSLRNQNTNIQKTSSSPTPDLTQKPDVVEFSSSKKQEEAKKSGINKKILLTGAAIAGALAGVAFCIYKNRTSELKKLAPNIEFKQAQTLEEAFEFGKQTLGIKQYSGFEAKDLEVVNWINEGFVNTSNALKGEIRMPKEVVYDSKLLGKNALAGVVQGGKGIAGLYNGLFAVNKNIFDNIDERIANNLQEAIEGGVFKKLEDGSCTAHHFFAKTDSSNELLSLIKKFENKEKLTFNEKARLFDEIGTYGEFASNVCQAPLVFAKRILNNKNFQKRIVGGEEKALELIKEIEAKPKEKQLNSVVYLMKKFNLAFEMPVSSPFRTIYHEMGHTQDMTPRAAAIEKFDDASKYPEELKKWLDNDKNMQLANSVSLYASHGPGEFIAETFADLLSGRKLPKEVLELYKSMNGPKIPDII